MHLKQRRAEFTNIPAEAAGFVLEARRDINAKPRRYRRLSGRGLDIVTESAPPPWHG